eukprot:TRINITY_DN27343_c0_g1_i7.p1 TRINITY_DN27343_c0_g1~~TRINITY_DN27343_c0_g1_i7.p1  ORF type:complete len:147 (+),score=41.81 TRINITY_DN27343_c0_g1_i7:60-500(+)
MSGERELGQLLANMSPSLDEHEYVFTTVPADSDVYAQLPRAEVLAEFKEREGVTLVVRKEAADQFGAQYDGVMAWITLEVHSSLDAVGFTAAFARALGNENMSCNVMAGFYHDHLFVDHSKGPEAVQVLQKLREQSIRNLECSKEK